MKLDVGDVIPDGELLGGISRGDREAFAEFYRRHGGPLFAFLVKLVRERDMAEEVLGETMLDIWRQAGRFESRSSVATWLFSVCHDKAVRRLRRQRETVMEDDAVTSADDGPTPDSPVDGRAMAQLLPDLMARLSLDHCEILQLTYYQGFSVQEIAELLSLPENTVKTRMFFARQRLKTLLEAAGIKETVA